MVRIPPPERFGGIKTVQAETDRRVADLERVDGSQFGRILEKVKAIRDEIILLTDGLAAQVETYIAQFSRTKTEIDSKNADQDTAIAGKHPLFSVLSPGNGGTGTGNVHDTTSTGTQRQVFVTPGGLLTVGASSARFKQDIETAACGLADVLKLEPRQFRWRSEVTALEDAHASRVLEDDGGTPDDTDTPQAPLDYGLIAEEADTAGLSWLVRYGTDGRPDGILYERLPIALLDIARKQQDRITVLEAQIEMLAGVVNDLQTLHTEGAP